MEQKNRKKRDSTIANRQTKELLSEEQADFLTEMMNIGAGNAAAAFSQMLKCEVEVRLPRVRALPTQKAVYALLGDPSLPVVCVRMDMVSDVRGGIFLIVPDEYKTNLIRLMERATPGPKNKGPDENLSILAEIGNVLVGIYLTAIHDFCKLHIYHTIPTVAVDMVQSLLDESLNVLSMQVQLMIVIENEFLVEKKHIRAFLIMIPSVESVKTLLDSIEQARMAYGEE